MSKVKYPDEVIRARRQAIELSGSLEIYQDGDKHILCLFGDEYSSHEKLSDALDEAAALILEGNPVDSVEFFQSRGVWRADMVALRADLYARRGH